MDLGEAPWLFGRFPELGVPPVIHFSRIFPNKNHPAIGVPPFQEALHLLKSKIPSPSWIFRWRGDEAFITRGDSWPGTVLFLSGPLGCSFRKFLKTLAAEVGRKFAVLNHGQ